MSGQEWRLQAACRDAIQDGRSFGGAAAQAGFIKEFCRHCDVKPECLRFGVAIDSDGVYGGTTRRQRVKLGLVPKAAERWSPGKAGAA